MRFLLGGSLLLIAVALVIRAGEVIRHHLIAVTLILVFTGVLIALAIRPASALINKFGRRFIVKHWTPVTPPQTRRARGLPEPLPSEAAAQPFTAAEDATVIAGDCQGPKCANPLPGDPDARWRAGNGAEAHEFCSEQCAMDWVGAGEMLSPAPLD